jgi:phosphoglycerol transferase
MRKIIIFTLYVLQAIFVLATAFISLRLYQYDLRVPFGYDGDAVVMLTYIKGILLNGWAWDIPQLSAPYGMSASAFPMMTNFDWLIIKMLSLLTSDLGLLINIFWLSTLVFSAWSATFAIRLMGVGKHHLAIPLAVGVLYAFLPYALLRNVHHLSLVYYIVPLLAVLAIHIASGLRVADGTWIRHVAYAACLAQGLNYIYYSFFAVLLFCFASIFAYVNYRSRDSVKVAFIAISLIIVATAINLSPTFYSWHKFGKPPGMMEAKQQKEAEIYGLKIRRMLVPHKNNFVPVLAKWANADIAAAYPLENENGTARLGLAGATGFLLLLLVSLRLVKIDGCGSQAADALRVLASLSLVTVLIITVGGFGAILNLAVGPDIRCYNRYSVFISFFALACINIFLGKWWDVSPLRPIWKLFGITTFVALSLYDQLLHCDQLSNIQFGAINKYNAEKKIIERLERAYPNSISVSVLQFPMTGFPFHRWIEKMSSYDQLHPFLLSNSNNMRWSGPSFSKIHRAWQQRISRLDGEELLKAAIYSGFSAIWVDRFGYKDLAAKFTAGLLAAGATPILLDARYIVLDLREATKKIKSEESHGLFYSHVASWIN